MIRPGQRLLTAAIVGLCLTVAAVAIPAVPAAAAVAVWAGLGLAMLADLILTGSARGLRLTLDGPDEIFTGESGALGLRLGSGDRPVPSGIRARLALPEGLGGDSELSLTPHPDGGAIGSARLVGSRRGEYRIDRVWLMWPSRFGLFELTPVLAADLGVAVIPNIRPALSGRIDVDVKSELYGLKDIAIRGEGSEFHQLREFLPGMDTRSIDWKHSARRRDLVAKETRAERNHQVILCLDNGYLMREEIDGLPKIDHAVNAALALAWAAGLGGDLVALYSFDAKPRAWVPPQPGRAAFPRLRRHMAAMGYQTVESNHTLALTHLGGLIRRRSLIVIFSDFVDTTTAELLVENVAVLSRHHVVVFVALRDPLIEARGRRARQSLDGMAEAVAAGQLARERQIVFDRLARLGVMCIDTEAGKLTPRLVSTYLTIKAREMI